MKLGVFGGSFNPPHMGHLIVLESVRDQLQFDKILFILSAQTPNKHDACLAPATRRLEMTKLAIHGNPTFEVSDIEVQRQGISYTIDTLTALGGFYPKADLSLIIGADNFFEFQTWKSPEDILTKADLVVMNRPGFSSRDVKHQLSRRAHFVNVPLIGISGTDIRRRIKLGRSIRFLVPAPVEEYIRLHRLYKD
ncbi:MAG: nicotinate (nicotinamide) nucleotide adenylyltransferase [Ignavibacteria bacterium]|nr:nicotinate (nicotinamide) nucleotide adenylyltransferase [Ignavibacteria bacterium]